MSEFQVGDRVRVTQGHDSYAEFYRGDIGTVTATDGSRHPYGVFMDDGNNLYFDADELEHVRQFKVGDLVRVRDDSDFLPGRIGVVEFLDDYNRPYDYRVRLVDNRAFYFTEDELEPRGFQVGDRVRVRPFDGDDRFLRERAGREGVVILLLDDFTAPNGWTVEVRLNGDEWPDIFTPAELEFIEEGEPETPTCGCGLCTTLADSDNEDSEDVQSNQLTFQDYLAEFGVERVDPVRSEALKRALEYVSEWRIDDVIEVARGFELYLRGK